MDGGGQILLLVPLNLDGNLYRRYWDIESRCARL